MFGTITYMDNSHTQHFVFHVCSPFCDIFRTYRYVRKKLNNEKDLTKFEDQLAQHFTYDFSCSCRPGSQLQLFELIPLVLYALWIVEYCQCKYININKLFYCHFGLLYKISSFHGCVVLIRISYMHTNTYKASSTTVPVPITIKYIFDYAHIISIACY